MKKGLLYRILSGLFIMALCSPASSQQFEGWVLYKLEVFNPNPEIFSDSVWQQAIREQFGDRPYIIQKYYYKNDRYFSEVDAGTESGFILYNPQDRLLYTWGKDSDTALIFNTAKYIDEMTGMEDGAEEEMINGIPCRSVILHSKMGNMTLWYNEQYLKMNPELYKGHLYGHWEHILNRIGCLPLKIETKGLMGHTVQTVLDFREEAVNDNLFIIPEFAEITASPVN